MLCGSCLCGQVRYQIEGTPMHMYYCHCTTCQKATGTAFAINILVPTAAFTIVDGQDRLGAFESSPNKHRYFCTGCGSPIYSHGDGTSFVSVRCGTLDGDPETRPTIHYYAASKAPWDEIGDALPQLPRGTA